MTLYVRKVRRDEDEVALFEVHVFLEVLTVVDTRLSAQDEARSLRLPVMIRELEIVDSRGYAKIKIVVANNELNGNGSV